MSFITNSLLVDLCLSLLTFAFCVYKFWTRNYNYWEKRRVVHMKPSFPLGTLRLKFIKGIDTFGLANDKIYHQFKGERYVGIYNLSEPQLMIRDPELVKYILAKDFNHFVNRGISPEIKHDYTTKNLFNLEGDAWKKMRMKLTPTFTSELTLEEMAAQMFVFFAAGFETASGTTSFCLFELSKNKHIQDKVRSQIDAVFQKNGGKVTYEALQEMPYMDKCINETLRMYTSLPFLNRKCVKTYQVPDSDLVTEKGMNIFIPTYSIHHDPEYYPQPYKFDPERFSEEDTNSRHQYTHLPFGEGQRICIGKRLGMMQVKMGLIAILKDFEVTPFPGLLPDQLPLNPRSFLTVSAIH